MRRGVGICTAVLALGAWTLTTAATAPAAVPCSTQAKVRVLSDGHGSLESVAVDPRGRLFFTDSEKGQLLRMRRRGSRPKVILDGIDGPGGIVFRHRGKELILGYGDTVAQAGDGQENPEAGLLSVNPRSGRAHVLVDGLQMANGVARGPGGAIYATIDVADGGIDRVKGRRVKLGWADVFSANGLVADRRKRSLFVNQTFTSAAIQRVPLDDPVAASTYFAADPADAAAGFDGLARDERNRLFVAANGAGQIWRVDGPHSACVLAERVPYPNGPSDVAFGRKHSSFPRKNLYVTTFGGELLELVGARNS